MKRIIFIIIFLLFTGTNIKAQAVIAPLADKAAFEAAIANNEKAVVVFAAEWCDYCKAFLPKVEKITSDYEKIKFFRINYDENMALFQAKGTVKFYKNSR